MGPWRPGHEPVEQPGRLTGTVRVAAAAGLSLGVALGGLNGVTANVLRLPTIITRHRASRHRRMARPSGRRR